MRFCSSEGRRMSQAKPSACDGQAGRSGKRWQRLATLAARACAAAGRRSDCTGAGSAGVPHLQAADDPPGDVCLPPLQAVAGAEGEGVVVVVPALAKGGQRQPGDVGGEVGGGVGSGAPDVARTVHKPAARRAVGMGEEAGAGMGMVRRQRPPAGGQQPQRPAQMLYSRATTAYVTCQMATCAQHGAKGVLGGEGTLGRLVCLAASGTGPTGGRRRMCAWAATPGARRRPTPARASRPATTARHTAR